MQTKEINRENFSNQIANNYQEQQDQQLLTKKVHIQNDNNQNQLNQQIQQTSHDQNIKNLKIDQESSDDEQGNVESQCQHLDLIKQIHDIKVSQLFAQYIERISQISNIYMNKQDLLKQSTLQTIQKRLLQNQQFQKCQNFQSQLSIISIHPTKYYQIVTIWIQCGWYKTKVVILNYIAKDNQSSPLHNCAHINGFGAFGNIYFVNFLKLNYAVKCIPIDRQNQTVSQDFHDVINSIAEALEEFFFLKLFSELKIGPKIKQCFGFDIIFSRDCVQFSMQLCTPLIITPQHQKKIIDNMIQMHLLQIVHRDIKPDNLMWSQEFQNPVFIDFGVTSFIKEKLGTQSMTRFSGTIGFVSPQMTKVFTEKTGIADLYYNDLFGLIKSFQFFKRFSNTQNSLNTKQKPSVIRDLVFTIYLLKYKLLTKSYTQFIKMWQQLQKYHFYELQSIQCEILQFLIELRPNKFLSNLHRQISEQIRGLEQFQGLKDIYLSELSSILSIWTKFQQKNQKFKKTICIYKQISAKFEIISDIERRIQNILISRQSARKFIQQSNDCLSQEAISEQKILIYFVVLAYFCTLAHDKLEIKLRQKISVAQEALNIIILMEKIQQAKAFQQSLQKPNIKILRLKLNKLYFVCPLKQLEYLAYLYQFLIFRLWPYVPHRFKNQVLKFIISSLSLMGYPFYINAAKDIFKYYLFQNPNQQKLNSPNFENQLSKILLFWKFVSMVNVYSEICYNRQQTNFLMQNQIVDLIQQETIKFQQQLMENYIDDDDSFMKLNHHFYQFHTKKLTKKYPSDVIMKILNDLQKQHLKVQTKLNWPKYFSEFKQSIRLLFNILPGRPLLPIQLGILYESKPIILEYQQSIDFSLYFSSFIKYCVNSWNLQRVGKVFKIINQTIVYDKIIQRFYIDFRIYVAWKTFDIPIMKKSSLMICQATKNISPYNFNYLYSVGLIIHKILLLQRKCFWDFIIQKLICFQYLNKIVQRMKYYISFYTDTKNIPSPDQILAPRDQLIKDPNVRYKQLNYFVDQSTMTNLILNQTEEKLFNVFTNVQASISLISSLLRYAVIFRDQGLKKEYFKLFQNYKEIDIVTHLNTILPQKIKSSLFLSENTQNQLLIFLEMSIYKISSPQVSLNKYYNAYWNLNNKLLIQIPIQKSNDFDGMQQNFRKHYQEEDLFRRVANNSINIKMNPSPRVGAIYFLSKLVASNQENLDNYRELIDFYKLWVHHHEVYKVMFQTQMITYILNGFIYCQNSHQQFFQFFLDITSFLNTIRDKFAIQMFRQAIWDKFFCMCKDCFPFPPKNWKPLEFIKFIYDNRKLFTETSHPYMGIVIIAALPNKYIPLHIKRRFVIFAVKSMQHLPSSARQYIQQHIYFEIFYLKLIDKGFYKPPQFNQDGLQIKPQVKVVYNQNIIRSQYYHAQKYFKSQKRIGSIDQLIQQRHKVKRKRKPNWKLPYFIQKVYHKKLKRYHLLIDGYDQNTKIQPNVQLLQEFQ